MGLGFNSAPAPRAVTMVSPDSPGGDESGAVERLVEAVAPLWPGARLSVRRGGSLSARERSWLVFPSLTRPTLLVPPSCRAASIALQPTGTGRGAVTMRSLSFLQRSGLLRLLPLHRLVLSGTPGPEAAESVVAQALGPVEDVVVRLGRRRYNRALVLLPFDRDGRLLGVVKIARGETARRVLRQEHDALVRANDHAVPGLQVPAPLAHVETGDLGYFVMSPLTSDEVGRPRPVPVRQMLALADVGRGPWRPMRSTRAAERLRCRVAALRDPAHRDWTGAALDALLEELGDVEVPQGAWHGDWVPWNMAREGDEIQLWDWEHFDREALRGWDHVHYLAQDLRTRSGTTRAVEDAWLAEAEQALAEDWGLEAPQRRAVLRSYLLEINLRYLHDRQEDPLGTPARAGWARGLVERLAAPASGTTGTGTSDTHTDTSSTDTGATDDDTQTWGTRTG